MQDKYLPRLERALRAGTNGYLVGGVMSMADVQLLYVLGYVTLADATLNPVRLSCQLASNFMCFVTHLPVLHRHPPALVPFTAIRRLDT
jgi:hypothetical protein